MPTNVVKTPEDEKIWARAKKQAAKQGQGKNFAYVMAIFQQMKNASPRGNPLDPFPTFLGPAAWGGTEGGVHTADTIEQAVAYANLKGEPPDDYPVVLVLDVAHLDRIPDLDVRRAAKAIRALLSNFDLDEQELEADPDVAVESFHQMANDWLEDGSQFDEAPGESTQNWLFKHSDPSIDENALSKFRDHLNAFENDEQARLLRSALAGQLEDDDLMAIWGQGRYMTPIEESRVRGVYFVPPWFRVVVDGDEDEELVEQMLDSLPGYNVLFSDEVWTASPSQGARLVWGKEARDKRDEFHGTSWRNFSAAFPELAEQIETPPAPYVRSSS